MTGSIILNRQYSSTVGLKSKGKLARPKLRRCSSVDDHGSFESTTDESFQKKFIVKSDPTSNEHDSGIEDSDQQTTGVAVATEDNDQKEEIHESDLVFTAGDDEGYDANVPQTTTITTQSNGEFENFDINVLHRDIVRASSVKDEEKKEFCQDTSIVFHAEFARLISMPIELAFCDISYNLFPEYGMCVGPESFMNYANTCDVNAKVQFRCPNPACNRLWTSMRGRVSFKYSYPMVNGFVFVKLYEQICEQCQIMAEPLWYMEEVCRVMKVFKNFLFAEFFSQLNQIEDVESTETPNENQCKSRYDSKQRQGKMRAPHNPSLCIACYHGRCFIKSF